MKRTEMFGARSLKRLQQRPEQQEHDVVAGRDAKRPTRALGLERPPQVQQIFDLANAVVHGPDEIGGERRELEIAADAHEQLVLKCVPQPREDSADRRLAQEQRSPARVTLRSVSSTSSATSRLRSN